MSNKSWNHDEPEESSITEKIVKSLIGSVVFTVAIGVIKRVLPILWVLYP